MPSVRLASPTRCLTGTWLSMQRQQQAAELGDEDVLEELQRVVVDDGVGRLYAEVGAVEVLGRVDQLQQPEDALQLLVHGFAQGRRDRRRIAERGVERIEDLVQPQVAHDLGAKQVRDEPVVERPGGMLIAQLVQRADHAGIASARRGRARSRSGPRLTPAVSDPQHHGRHLAADVERDLRVRQVVAQRANDSVAEARERLGAVVRPARDSPSRSMTRPTSRACAGGRRRVSRSAPARVEPVVRTVRI